MTRTLIILSISPTWPISCHNTTRVNSAVHLPIWDQFTFSNMTPDCFCILITRPLLLLIFFSDTWGHHRHIPFFSRFFLLPIFQRMWSYSPEFLYAFPYTVTSPKVLVPYNSCLFLLLKYIPDTTILFKYAPQYIFFFYYAPLTWSVFSNTTPDWLNYLHTAPGVSVFFQTRPLTDSIIYTRPLK